MAELISEDRPRSVAAPWPAALAGGGSTPWGLAPWGVAIVAPLAIWPVWRHLWQNGPAGLPLQTFAGLVLLLAASTIVYTDLRSRRIPNWITYSAAAWGIGINAWAATALGHPQAAALGAVGLGQSLLGMIVLGAIMLAVFSITGGGAGDVKMAAAIGALLGLGRGIDAVAYAMTLAGVGLLVIGLIRYGPIQITRTVLRVFAWQWLPRWIDPPTAADRRLLHAEIPLGPFFAGGVALAVFDPGGNLPSWAGF